MTSQAKSPSIGSCRVCQRQGLPILPLRYAVTRTDGDDRAGHPPGPELNGPLLGSGQGVVNRIDDASGWQDVAGTVSEYAEAHPLKSIPLPAGQRYTMRLLRPGYLYVFNESRGEWQGYVITEWGYLIEYVSVGQDELEMMDVDNPGPLARRLQPPAREQELNCARNPEHAYPGRCLMIPDAGHADAIYLAFSDVAWTRRVWQAHARDTGGCRSGMRRVSLAQWRSEGGIPYADRLEKLGACLAEAHYPWHRFRQVAEAQRTAEDGSVGTALGFSPFDCHGIRERVTGLLRWAQEQADGSEVVPLLVGLDDPVGVCTELAALMRQRQQEFINRPEIKWPLATLSTIDSLREAIRQQAQLRYIEETGEEAVQRQHTPLPSLPMDHPPTDQEIQHYREEIEEADERAREQAIETITVEQLEAAADATWYDYQSTLRDGEPEHWRRDVFQPRQQAFDSEVITPLARAHLAWLTGGAMRHAMDAHFDEHDAESGEAFCAVLTVCLQDTQQNALHFEQYRSWLTAPRIEADNLLMRALVLNNKSTSEAINAAATAAVSGRIENGLRGLGELPWDALISGYQFATQDEPAVRAAPGRLLAAVMAPMLRALDERRIRPALIALGVIAERPIVYTRVHGHVSDAIDEVVETMKRINPALADVDSTLLKRQVEIKARGNRRRMRSLGGGDFDIEIAHDRLSIESIDATASERARINKAAESVLTYEEWRKVHASPWAMVAEREVQLGIIGLILGYWSLKVQAHALDESTADERTEQTWRHRALVAGLAGGVGELGHAMLKSADRITGRLVRGIGKLLRHILEFGGKGFGFVAASIMAFWDVYHTQDNVMKGYHAMAGLYLVSAASGIGLFYAPLVASMLGFSATAVGLVCAGALFVVTILVVRFENNDLQNWMEKCYFGVEERGDRFPGQKMEMAAFEALTQEDR